MTIDLEKTVSTVANVGVIVGIVFLAIELTQNNDELEVQNAITRHQNRISNIGATIHDESLAAAQVKLNRGERLTDIERERLLWVHAIKFLNWELGYQLGQTDTRPIIQSFINGPGQMIFWREYKSYLTPEFVNWVESEVFPHIDETVEPGAAGPE
jgi:hypothetical protein